MAEIIIEIVVGLVIITGGILGFAGKFHMLQSTKGKRASKEVIRAFDKKLGLSFIISGCVIIAAGITKIFSPDISDIILSVGFLPGSIMVLNALMKFNRNAL